MPLPGVCRSRATAYAGLRRWRQRTPA
jgi:hypothetical protein